MTKLIIFTTASLMALLALAACQPPPPPPPPPPPIRIAAPFPIPPSPVMTEPAVVTTRRYRGATTVSRRCPTGMHWVSSKRKMTTYQQGDRVVKVSKKTAGHCVAN